MKVLDHIVLKYFYLNSYADVLVQIPGRLARRSKRSSILLFSNNHEYFQKLYFYLHSYNSIMPRRYQNITGAGIYGTVKALCVEGTETERERDRETERQRDEVEVEVAVRVKDSPPRLIDHTSTSSSACIGRSLVGSVGRVGGPHAKAVCLFHFFPGREADACGSRSVLLRVRVVEREAAASAAHGTARRGAGDDDADDRCIWRRKHRQQRER